MFRRFVKSRSLLIEINPHQILVAGITRQRSGPVTIDYAAEFDRGNLAGVRSWIEGRKDVRKKWLAGVCGFIPRKGVLQRETLRATDLANPAQLIAGIRDRQTQRFSVSTAPFLSISPEQWTFRAVNALDGSPLPEGDANRPALLVGLANDELHEVQQHLLECRLIPQQLEHALLPLFGSIYQLMERRRQPRAAVIFVLKEDSAAIYILGKEGVHTRGHIAQGLSAVVQQVRKEFALTSDDEALRLLRNPDEELRARAPKLLRHLGAEIRPVINYYEMTTGQPAGDVYCAYLPPDLAWIAEPLVKVMDHELLVINCQEWMPTVGLQPADGLPSLGPHWLGALSLAANLPEAVGHRVEISRVESESFNRPWHPDCRPAIEPPGSRLMDRRFLAAAGSIAVMLFALAVAGWQWHVTKSLQKDTVYWQEQMASNRQLLTEITTMLKDLRDRNTRLDHAHGLMKEPVQTTEFLMELGRTLPPRLRVDRIEANERRVLLAGNLLEPAEEASRSLGRYLDTLRRTPGFRDLFTTISATSLQREGDSDTLMFEITMKLKPPPS